MARFFIDRPIFAWVIAICIMLAVPRATTPGPEAEAATAEEAASRPQSATTPTIPAGWVRGPAARDASASSGSDNFEEVTHGRQHQPGDPVTEGG